MWPCFIWDGDAVQLVKHLPSLQGTPGWVAITTYKLSVVVVVCICNPRMWEVEARGSNTQGHRWLNREAEGCPWVREALNVFKSLNSGKMVWVQVQMMKSCALGTHSTEERWFPRHPLRESERQRKNYPCLQMFQRKGTLLYEQHVPKLETEAFNYSNLMSLARKSDHVPSHSHRQTSDYSFTLRSEWVGSNGCIIERKLAESVLYQVHQLYLKYQSVPSPTLSVSSPTAIP